MPTYEYRCLECDHQFERFQRMSDEPVKECEICGSAVKRLLFPVAIHFKGSGFYSTDYARRNALGSTATGSATGGDSEKTPAGESADRADKPKSSASDSSASAESKGATPAPAGAAKND